MSYYSGAELSELPETACGVNYMYDSDGSNLGSILSSQGRVEMVLLAAP